mmetsp:Transcript_16768/g.30064  ORF Transcript_16768/g.30064 Transcript_16768/m.30064 type:complete len:95 (+) Transcript_16768:153-437(+)
MTIRTLWMPTWIPLALWRTTVTRNVEFWTIKQFLIKEVMLAIQQPTLHSSHQNTEIDYGVAQKGWNDSDAVANSNDARYDICPLSLFYNTLTPG